MTTEEYEAYLQSRQAELIENCIKACQEHIDTNPHEYVDVWNHKGHNFEDVALDLLTRELDKIEKGADEIPDDVSDECDTIEVEFRYTTFDKVFADARYKKVQDANDSKYLYD